MRFGSPTDRTLSVRSEAKNAKPKTRHGAVGVVLIAGLLWLSLLLGDLIGPIPPSADFTSPVLRRALALAAGICLVVALLISAFSLTVARTIEIFTRVDPEQRHLGATASVVAILASDTVLVLRKIVHARAESWAWEPEFGFVLLVASACAAAGATTVLILAVARKPRSILVCCLGLAGIAGWVAASLWLRGDHQGAPARLGLVVGLTSFSAALLYYRQVYTAPRFVGQLALVLALVAPVSAVVARVPVSDDLLGSVSRPAAPGALSVVLIVIDTLRADHTGFAQYPRETTPELVHARRATYFSETSAAGSATLPSVAALFTSRLPADFERYDQLWRTWRNSSAPGSLDEWTIARAFRDAGYRTGGFSGTGTVDKVGFRIGFESFVSTAGSDYFVSSFPIFRLFLGERLWPAWRSMENLRLHKSDSSHLCERALEWIQGNDDERPFFAFVHLLDPHWPFYEHGLGLIDDELRGIEKPLSHVDLIEGKRFFKGKKLQGTPALRELIGRYDEEVRWSDRAVGRLLDEIDAAGLRKNTLVVVVADHGEEFFEHGSFSHGHDVFEELIHVPMLFLWPDQPEFEDMPAGVDVPVSLLDVLPTLTDFLDLSLPPRAAMRGKSLRPLLEGTHEGKWAPVISMAGSRWQYFSYREGQFKVRLVYPRDSKVKPSQVAIYNLARDPKEEKVLSISRGRRGLVVRAQRSVKSIFEKSEHATAGEPPVAREDGEKRTQREEEESLELLRALGYVE